MSNLSVCAIVVCVCVTSVLVCEWNLASFSLSLSLTIERQFCLERRMDLTTRGWMLTRFFLRPPDWKEASETFDIEINPLRRRPASLSKMCISFGGWGLFLCITHTHILVVHRLNCQPCFWLRTERKGGIWLHNVSHTQDKKEESQIEKKGTTWAHMTTN